MRYDLTIKRNMLVRSILILTVLLAAVTIYYIFTYQQENLTEKFSYEESVKLRKTLDQMIVSKQKATTAIALALSLDDSIVSFVQRRNVPDAYFRRFLQKLRDQTLYKNIWIQLIDTEGNSLYKSYCDKNEGNLKEVRADIATILRKPRVYNTISIGFHDMTFRSLVPIYDENGTFIAVLEVASHFNSIEKQLKKNGVYSVAIAVPPYTQRLVHPFSGIFIQDYYVANLHPEEKVVMLLREKGVDSFLGHPLSMSDRFLVVDYPLYNIQNEHIGSFLLFEPLSELTKRYVKPAIHKSVSLVSATAVGIVFILGLLFLYNTERLKRYYKKVLDSSSNIVIITDGRHILDTNKTFFKYFYRFKTLQAFLERYSCICDLFQNEPGYLQSEMDGKTWIEYLIANPQKEKKAKILYEKTLYYFTVRASILDEAKKQYSIIMIDTTNEELYKRRLKLESITDALTHCFNRRHFEEKFRQEIEDAKRHGYALSLLMFDIDYFKKINDTYGHTAGDFILQNLSKRVRSLIRTGDICFRVGGEEFVLLLPYTQENEAFRLANRILVDIRSAPLYEEISVTLSIGLITVKENETLEDAYKRVDQALYSAKQNGRNQIVTG